MSTTAPWLALACDWMDSEMFDGATDGERLAWVCLLCYVKSHGRAGKAKVRGITLQRRYELSERSVSGMLKRAQKCAAITIDEGCITVCNWRVYQDRKYAAEHRQKLRSLETPQKSATHHPGPTTQDPDTQIPREESPHTPLVDPGSGEVTPAERYNIRSEHWPLVDAVLGAAPDRMKSRPTSCEAAVIDHIALVSRRDGVDDYAAASAFLVQRLGEYAESPQGSGEYFINLPNWINERSYDMPGAWGARDGQTAPEEATSGVLNRWAQPAAQPEEAT